MVMRLPGSRFLAERLAYHGSPALPFSARKHRNWLYTAVLCTLLMLALVAWRFAAASQGVSFDDTWDAIGWLHRTFILTVVYLCGTTILATR